MSAPLSECSFSLKWEGKPQITRDHLGLMRLDECSKGCQWSVSMLEVRRGRVGVTVEKSTRCAERLFSLGMFCINGSDKIRFSVTHQDMSIYLKLYLHLANVHDDADWLIAALPLSIHTQVVAGRDYVMIVNYQDNSWKCQVEALP
ncbi:MAG: hypothetical protein JSR97_02790 [Verrucomicrobia bacterium]|nr:hypothetical protein [Verrucomicrobiota bacterium]